MELTIFLLVICLIGIFYLALAALSAYFVVAHTDKNQRALDFDNLIGSGALGSVVLGFGVAGLLRQYSLSPSSVNTTVVCLIAVPSFLFALVELVKWLDGAKFKEYADDKTEEIAFIGVGTGVCLIASLFTYLNR